MHVSLSFTIVCVYLCPGLVRACVPVCLCVILFVPLATVWPAGSHVALMLDDNADMSAMSKSLEELFEAVSGRFQGGLAM